MYPGDIVWFPPGEKHWHGATPEAAMMHIAVQETLDGRNVDSGQRPTSEAKPINRTRREAMGFAGAQPILRARISRPQPKEFCACDRFSESAAARGFLPRAPHCCEQHV